MYLLSLKVIFNELPLRIQILYVKSSEVHYYLELKAKKIVCSKGEKEKTTYMEIIKMFIHIEYSLQIVHCYYSGVQDTTLQIDTRAIFINNLLASYGDVSWPY